LYGRRATDTDWRAGWDWWCGSALTDACRHARERKLWIAIATQAGTTDDEDFPGLAALVDPRGDVVVQTPDWTAADLVVEVDA
jgi:predicted amidohydrolase